MVAGQLKCWVKLLIHSQNLTVAPLKFETGEVISDDVFVNENVVEIIDNNIDDIFVLPPQTTNTHTHTIFKLTFEMGISQNWANELWACWYPCCYFE